VAVGASVAEEGTTLLKDAGSVLPLTASNAGTIAVIGPAASASPTYAGGGSAYVIPFSTVTALAGIQAAAGSGTTVTYSQGLPTNTSLPSISSSVADLPLQGTFTMAATPAGRQAVITAPSTMQPGQASTVQVQLTASGDETLPDVQLALQLPQGWTAVPAGAYRVHLGRAGRHGPHRDLPGNPA
jgi:hypothetical protein